jgi:hypothetical protein
MDREKQIEEMAKVLHERCREISEDTESLAKLEAQGKTMPDDFAEALHNAGYRKASEVAEEIFAEIEEIRLRQIRKSEFFRNGSTEEMERKFYEGAEWGLRQLSHWIAELKKKYTEGGECL